MRILEVSTSPFGRDDYRRSKARVYVHISQETILENLFSRHSRQWKGYIPFVITALSEMYGCQIDPKTIKWNQKAGCACGCSPGFIVDKIPVKNYHITIGE